MIVMVTSLGPSTGSQYGTGFTMVAPQLEKIHTSTGKMTMVFMNGTMPKNAGGAMLQSIPVITAVSNNAVTVRFIGASGVIMSGAQASANLAGAEFVLIADGY